MILMIKIQDMDSWDINLSCIEEDKCGKYQMHFKNIEHSHCDCTIVRRMKGDVLILMDVRMQEMAFWDINGLGGSKTCSVGHDALCSFRLPL